MFCRPDVRLRRCLNLKDGDARYDKQQDGDKNNGKKGAFRALLQREAAEDLSCTHAPEKANDARYARRAPSASDVNSGDA